MSAPVLPPRVVHIARIPEGTGRPMWKVSGVGDRLVIEGGDGEAVWIPLDLVPHFLADIDAVSKAVRHDD